MKLLLISGHGAGDGGASGQYGGRTYQEATETRRVTADVARDLAGDCAVTIYPTARNAFADYQAGVLDEIAHFDRYDYVLEIHFNALRQDDGDGKTKGVECYVPRDEPETAVEEDIVRNVAACGFTNRGVKRRDWSVIRAAWRAGTPAALLEVCFIDNADDMAVYLEKREEIAQAIAEGIRQGFSLGEEEPMTYEQFVAWMDRYLAQRAQEPPAAWSAEARAWAEEAGIVRGDGAGQMRYRSFVTREETVEMLYRLSRLEA